MIRAIAGVLNRMLATFDLRIVRQSSLLQRSEAEWMDHLRDGAEMIGLGGSNEVFAAFVSRHLRGDDSLTRFLRFYVEHYRLSRSQWSQDMFVMYATSEMRNGRYLEVGAADGVTHSNTLALRDHFGWSGTLIEPDPALFGSLRLTRGGSDRVVNAALSPDGVAGSARFRRVDQLSCLEGHEGGDCHLDARLRAREIITVQTLSLTKLLLGESRFDYLSLDVEGAEFGILKSVDWGAVSPPRVLTVECNGRQEDIQAIRHLLRSVGYSECFADEHWLTRGDLWMIHSASVV